MTLLVFLALTKASDGHQRTYKRSLMTPDLWQGFVQSSVDLGTDASAVACASACNINDCNLYMRVDQTCYLGKVGASSTFLTMTSELEAATAFVALGNECQNMQTYM